MVDATNEEPVTLAEAIANRTERPLTLTKAARLLPGRRGKHLSVRSMFRYAFDGINGVRLETARVGGQRVTSREAVARFVARLNGGDDRRPKLRPSDRSRRAAAELDRAGF